jgi:membrane-associated protease RseP (regulator of RpoE activity)
MKTIIPIILASITAAAHCQNNPEPPPAPVPNNPERPFRQPQPNREGEPVFRPNAGQPGEGQFRKPREVMTPFLGVISRPAAAEVRAQLKLGVGFGLAVDEVMPDSPAAAAGLRENDILIRLNDQRLVSAEQLQFLIIDAGKDKEVTLTFIREGAPQSATAKIVEKLMPERRPMPSFQPGGQPMQPGFIDPNGGPRVREFQNAPREDRPRGERIFRRDAEGRYELQLGPEPAFHAMDTEGKTTWRGPIGTPEQRNAVPEKLRGILDGMTREAASPRQRNPQPFQPAPQ